VRSSERDTADGAAELAIYALVAILLIVTGALLRTITLNWLVGPGSVVIGVLALSALVDRRGRRR
jgi:hypothetical protein